MDNENLRTDTDGADNKEEVTGSVQPSRSEMLSRYKVNQVYFLQGGFMRVRKVTNKDVVFRPLDKYEAKKIIDDIERKKIEQEQSSILVKKVEKDRELPEQQDIRGFGEMGR